MKNPEKLGVGQILGWIDDAPGNGEFARMQERILRTRIVAEGIALAYEAQSDLALANAERALLVVSGGKESLSSDYDLGFAGFCELARGTAMRTNRTPRSYNNLRVKCWNGIVRHFKNINGQMVVWYPGSVSLDSNDIHQHPEQFCRVNTEELSAYIGSGGSIEGFGKATIEFLDNILLLAEIRGLPETAKQHVV